MKRNVPLPDGWGEDPLADVMHAAFVNSLATFVHKKKAFGFLSKVDGAYRTLEKSLHNFSGGPLFPALLYRSYCAFLASCRLSMRGQATETFPMLRSCLEYALYALHDSLKRGTQ